MSKFADHRGHAAMFGEGKLTLGLFLPIESYTGSIPRMQVDEQIRIARHAEEAGFASLFVRDVPLNDPSFGDVGQIYDPWVFLGYLAAMTSRIALGTGSIVATLRHPLHIAKSAASVDRLSGQRLIMGLATGDRPIEFSAFRVDKDHRDWLFREAVAVMREAWGKGFPTIETPRVGLSSGDPIPKPLLGDIPILVTGHSAQSSQWIAENSDGWLYYPRSAQHQVQTITQWRAMTGTFKPFSQSLYIDLSEHADEPPSPIHLGFRSGHRFVTEFLTLLQDAGVNHVVFNLKYGKRPAEEVVQELGEMVVPHFRTLAPPQVAGR